MKKFFPYFCFLFLLGLLIPYVYGQFPKAFIYVLVVLVLTVMALLIKKGRITVFDWLIIYMGLIPLHSLKVGTASVFLRLTEISFIPLGLWWIVHRRRAGAMQKVSAFKQEYLILVFFFIFTFMSITQSIKPVISIYRSVILIYLVVLSFLVADISRDLEKVLKIIKAMMIISSIAGFIALCQSVYPPLYPFTKRSLVQLGGLTIIRAGVGWFDPGYFGLYIAMIIPVTLSCIFCGKFKDTVFFKRCLVLQLAGLISSYSRLSLGGVFTATVFLLFVYKRKKLAVALVSIVLLLLAGMSVARSYIYEHQPYIAAYIFRIAEEDVLKEHPTLVAGYRMDSWRANIAMFLDNPILGVGPFMSTDMYFKYRPIDDMWRYDQPLAVHSEYLSLLSERGILGFGSFALFLIVLFRHAAIQIKKYSDTKSSALIAGLKAGIISWLVFSVGGATIYSVQLWISVGLLIALFEIVKNENTQTLFISDNI